MEAETGSSARFKSLPSVSAAQDSVIGMRLAVHVVLRLIDN